MSDHIKGCSCGAHIPQRVIDAARESNRKVAEGVYRSLDLAALTDEEFERWLDDKTTFGEFDGFTISGLSREKRALALLGRPVSGMSAGTAETHSGSGRKPASPTAEGIAQPPSGDS
jgi:hypothetical protein